MAKKGRRVVRVDLSPTEYVLGVCWAAKDGERHADRELERLMNDDRARPIIADFHTGKYKRPRGMQRGTMTKRFDGIMWRRDVVSSFIQRAKLNGSKKPVYEGTLDAAKWLKKEGYYLDHSVDQVVNRLQGDRRRGGKKLSQDHRK